MARFIGYLEGSRGETSRLGTPTSGIRAQAQGWNVGVRVFGRADGDTDKFLVYATSGSTGGRPDQLLGVVRLDGDELKWEPA